MWEQSRVHFAFLLIDDRLILVCRFFTIGGIDVIRLDNKKTLSYVLLTLTTIIWGAGFVFNNMASQANVPAGLMNTLRFGTATLLLLAIFNKKIVYSKKMLLYGALCGVSLAVAFFLQYYALNYTTPANNSFFTCFYVAFVPILHWIITKKAPKWLVFLGIATTIAGLAILNFGYAPTVEHMPNAWIGNLITVGCAIFFAVQIVVTDFALKNDDVDATSLTFWQIAFASVGFVLYTIIFEVGTADFAVIDWKHGLIALAYLSVLGTGFAYPSQIFSQKHLHPATCSLIMAMEGVLGATFSVIAKIDTFHWNLLWGGLLVTSSIVIVEVLPYYLKKKK